MTHDGLTLTAAYRQRDCCPCCGAPGSATGRWIFSSPRAEDVGFGHHGSFLSGITPHRIFFSYLRCAECDAFYCPTYYSTDQLELLYERQPENMSDVPVGSRGRTQDGYLQILRRHSRMAGGLLEIGADIGLFAEACVRAGQFNKIWLTEPNQNAQADLRRRFAAQNATLVDAGSLTSEIPMGAISTAAMIHVLDHLPEPGSVLREVHHALEPGGVLMIVTHNVQSLLARVLRRRWPPFTLQHPQLFSPEGMRKLLASASFEVLEITRTTNYFPAAFLAHAGLTLIGLTASWLPQGLGPEIGVQLGNICTIARRPDRPR
jgi:SAM-dependent methyltransferase